jgi:hypothetical protein
MLFKNFLLFSAAWLLCGASATAQKKRFSLYGFAQAGGFQYYGPGAASNTSIYTARFLESYGYISNPFGKKMGLSFTAGISGQFNGRNGWLFGTGLSFENLRSNVSLDGEYNLDPVLSSTVRFTGSGHLTTRYVSLATLAGRRLWQGSKKRQLNLLLGLNHGFLLTAQEAGNAASATQEVAVKGERGGVPKYDLRLTGQLQWQQGRFMAMLTVNNSLADMQRGIAGGNRDYRVYGRSLLLGLGYRIF